MVHSISDTSDQTARMCRVILVFAVCTSLVGSVVRSLLCEACKHRQGLDPT